MSAGKHQPNVLIVIKEELMSRTIRELPRNYGPGRVKNVRSMEDAYTALEAESQEWDIFIADGARPDATDVIIKSAV